MKTCSNCGLSQATDEFHKSSRYSDGLQRWCKSCANIHGAYRMRRKLAIQNGVNFDLTFKQYFQIRSNTKCCPITGEEFRLHGFGNGQDSATLDRIDPNRGYEMGNVAFLSRKANSIKNCLKTSEEAETIFNNILEYMKSHGR